jgi:hypothetical protein
MPRQSRRGMQSEEDAGPVQGCLQVCENAQYVFAAVHFGD